MEDNNNIDPSDKGNSFIPETIDPKVNYLELEPENELNFIESKHRAACALAFQFFVGDSVNAHVHSSSTIDSPAVHSPALSYAFLNVKNVSNDFPVLFKIQTTSPIHYRVKPSHGRIEAGETKEIQSKNSHLFLIHQPTIL
jgi:hypothetical protein